MECRDSSLVGLRSKTSLGICEESRDSQCYRQPVTVWGRVPVHPPATRLESPETSWQTLLNRERVPAAVPRQSADSQSLAPGGSGPREPIHSLLPTTEWLPVTGRTATRAKRPHAGLFRFQAPVR